jgi:hypothetical protein
MQCPKSYLPSGYVISEVDLSDYQRSIGTDIACKYRRSGHHHFLSPAYRNVICITTIQTTRTTVCGRSWQIRTESGLHTLRICHRLMRNSAVAKHG